MKKRIKKLVAWPCAYTCMRLADGVGFLMDHWPSEKLYPYPVFHLLCGWSYDIQKWGRLSGPWKKADPA